MNPHNWQDFGDFAADAGLGALIVALLIAAGAFGAWLANRENDR